MTLKQTKTTGSDRFVHDLRAEWNNFRSARGLVIGMLVAVLLTVLPGLLIAASPASSCQDQNGNACAPLPIGPDGEAVADKFFFVHKPLTGDGSITIRVTSLAGLITYPPLNHDQIVPGVVPWAKAGVMIKDGVKQGAAYAAMMVTGIAGRGARRRVEP
jgi:hypothetical protein